MRPDSIYIRRCGECVSTHAVDCQPSTRWALSREGCFRGWRRSGDFEGVARRWISAGDCLTITGEKLSDGVADANSPDGQVVMRNEEALSETGGLVVLKGNLCRMARF